METRFEFEERMRSNREIEQAIVALKKGAHLLKCGKRGKPKLCPFRLSADEKMLIWYSKEKEKNLYLSGISNIVLGQKTVNFQKQRWPEKEPQSLSLIYENGECSIDLICKDKEQAESWFLGLESLTSNSKNPKSSSDLLNNHQQPSSCIYSPASFIRRRNKLATIQDPVRAPTIQTPLKFSKVRSLYGSPRYFADNAFDSSSEIFFSPRLRHGSEIESLLEKFIPHLPPIVPKISSVRADTTKDWKMSLVPSKGSLILDKNENLKDIFMWGNIPGNTHDNKKGKKVDPSFPRLLDSVQALQIQKIICGESHSALVTKQGEVFSWGEEKCGRLGHKTNIHIPEPKTIESISNFRINTLAFGAKHTCVLTTSGELYQWGETTIVETENKIEKERKIPWFPYLICGGVLDKICVAKVSCGDWHTCIISSTGSLYTYGEGTFGVLGHGDTKSISKPKQVEALKGIRVKSIACGPYHTASIVEIVVNNFKSNNPGGKLFTWGDGDGGKLGHKDREKKLVPTCVAGLVDQDFVQVSCGNVLTVGLSVSGMVFAMGSKIHGQLGNPMAKNGSSSSSSSITCVEGLLKTEYVKEISSGAFHVAVLTSSGKIYTWGKGSEGQLGLGNFLDRNSPCLVEALEDREVESLACGGNFTAVICLHKNISSRDQSICNGCKMVFGFTKKKHNCYHCGSIVCNSCSGNKVSKAALAPDRSKKYRVCDQCFSQFENQFDSSTKMDRVDKMEKFLSEIKTYTPKVSRIFKETSFNEERMRPREIDQKKPDSQFPGGERRWGQVDRPKCFSETGPIFMNNCKKISFSSDEIAKDIKLSKDLPCINEEVSLVDKILCQEIKTLRDEAVILLEQCEQTSSKIQQNRRQIEETSSFAKNEACNYKSLTDVIKLLINQRGVLSEKIMPKKEDLSNETSTSTSKNEKDNKITNFGNTDNNETIEQVERGVYITFYVSPDGKKRLKRIRFSRKHYNEEEAKKWWENNRSSALKKYNAEHTLT